MNLKSRKALVINLAKKEFNIKTYSDLEEFIGGVGVGIKLLQTYIDQDPVIFSIGPFNGFFPYASKTAVVTYSGGVVEDIYIGGTLSIRMRFAGLDSIVLTGRSEEPVTIDITNSEVTFLSEEADPKNLGLPGKRSSFKFHGERFLLDGYFKTPEKDFDNKIKEKNLRSLVLSGTENHTLEKFGDYTKLYKKLLQKKEEITINSGLNPSCSNCPLGCVKAVDGEIGGNVLLHSLVACQYAEKIYSDVGIVFMCLNTLGYNYTHEDVENLPKLIQNTLKEF